MPYPFVYQHPNPFTAPPWGNGYRSGPPWGVWQPSPSMNRPYSDTTSPWFAPPPLQPSAAAFPVPQPDYAQHSPSRVTFPGPPSHPSPQGYQASPQYISPVFPPSGSYSNDATATSRPHTPNVVPLSPNDHQYRNRSTTGRLRRPRSLTPCFRYSSLRTDAGYNNIVPTIIYYYTSRGSTIETRGTSQKFPLLICYFLYYLNADTDKRSRKVVTFHSNVGLKSVMVKDVWDALQIYAPHILRGAQRPPKVKWENLRRVELLFPLMSIQKTNCIEQILRSAVKDAFKTRS